MTKRITKHNAKAVDFETDQGKFRFERTEWNNDNRLDFFEFTSFDGNTNDMVAIKNLKEFHHAKPIEGQVCKWQGFYTECVALLNHR